MEGLTPPSPPSIDWSMHGDGDAAVVSLSGELDLSNVEALRADLRRVMTRGPGRLVFELSDLSFMDSSGLALLLEATQGPAPVELRAPSPAVRRLLELTGLQVTLPIVDRAGAALRASRTFEPVADSVHDLRAFVRAQCTSLPKSLLADLTLVASELATNAVQYARTTFDVRLELQEPDVVLEVSDMGDGVPRMGPEPSAGAPHGRGLRIVDAIADDWGVHPAQPGPGKTVWVRLSP